MLVFFVASWLLLLIHVFRVTCSPPILVRCSCVCSCFLSRVFFVVCRLWCCATVLCCRFAKTLLLGLAFACNFGGMVTPISSMQNVVARQALEVGRFSRRAGMQACACIADRQAGRRHKRFTGMFLWSYRQAGRQAGMQAGMQAGR